MPDLDLRSLERTVDQEPVSSGGVDARHDLTRERLRRSTGVVAWWAGAQSPHPSAARVTLTYETKRPFGHEVYSRCCPGWALAVGGVDDFFDLGRAARSVTFLDLVSGDWLRASARRSGLDLGTLRHQSEVTTVDAFGRPRATVRAATSAIDANRMGALTGATANGVSEGRVEAGQAFFREEGAYDSEWCSWDSTHVSFYQNFHAFSGNGAPRAKQWGLDTNISGASGSLPSPYVMDATGISVELFGADGRPLSRTDHEEIVGSAYGRFDLAFNPFGLWPLSALVAPPTDAEPLPEGFLIERPTPPVLPFAFPLALHALQMFRFSIDRPHMSERPNREGGFFARVNLHGFLGRASYA